MKNNSGFSIIEVMVVLTLILIIVSMIFVHISYSRRCMVCCYAHQLDIICRYLQLTAMIRKNTQILKFDINAGAYSYNTVTERLPDSVQFNFIDGAKGPPSLPSKPLKSAITFKNNEIIFYPDGIISSGTLYLTSKDKQVMYALSSPVAQISSLRVYNYDGSWHCRS